MRTILSILMMLPAPDVREQPRTTGRPRRRTASAAATAALCGLLVLSGCADAPVPQTTQSSPTADSAFALVQAMQRDTFRSAFSSLDSVAHVRRTRTMQLDDSGHVTAFVERSIARAPQTSAQLGTQPDAQPGAQGPTPSTRVLSADSAGTFQFGYLTRFVDTATDEPAHTSLPAEILPDELSFATQRHREGFRYRLMPDTSIASRRTRVVAIERRAAYADRYPLHRVRLYLDAGSRQLVGVRVERTDQTSFFDEETTLYAELMQSGASWLPRRTSFSTAIRLPLHSTRRFRTTTEFSGY